ncbi:MAG: hypothetical protein ACD_46C00280G0003 [uncultured bacterium]|nr:MAG: hypothetical protein ACD_46C00280G0003 [uncultured bacterium]
MFNGIVETIGTIISLNLRDNCKDFIITPHIPFLDINIGDSIAVNGVCLTVTSFSDKQFCVKAVPETLRLTNLDVLAVNDIVNLERAMQPTSRIGGHYVQGHIDNKSQILEIHHDQSSALIVKISIEKKLTKYIVDKGFITLDGMSITIIESTPTWFTVTLIPHTQQVTIAHQYRVGSWINIEVDMMAKYIEKLVGVYTHAPINQVG